MFSFPFYCLANVKINWQCIAKGVFRFVRFYSLKTKFCIYFASEYNLFAICFQNMKVKVII